MRSSSVARGLCALVVVVPLLGSAAGLVHGHAHRGDILNRVMHKSKAVAGSRLHVARQESASETEQQQSVVVISSAEDSCIHQDCQSNIPLAVVVSKTLQASTGQPQFVTEHGQDTSKESLALEATGSDNVVAKASSTAQHLTGPVHPVHELIRRQDEGYQSFVLQPFSQTSSSNSAPTASVTSTCPARNGTTFTSAANVQYQVICDIDFPNNDYAFLLVDSYNACVQKCDDFNTGNPGSRCVAALFVPSRESYSNDCYLKSSIARPELSTLGIEGAIVLSKEQSSSATLVSSTIGQTAPSAVTNTSASASSSVSVPLGTQTPAEGSSPGVTYANGKAVVIPQVAGTRLHGPSVNAPTKQYVHVNSPPVRKLAQSLLTIGVNGDLTTGYPLSPLTGVLDVNLSTQALLQPLSQVPHLSRDGGRGGYINGQHLFIFCDTGTYSPASSAANGQFLGFVSSSCATDVGMNGLASQPLNLQDGIGEWSDNAGRQRGFAPLTDGELAYNLAQQGNGQRYAVWPESSIIPLDATTAILYAPIVYDNVNRATGSTVFTYTGATLLTITAGGKGGPSAKRTVERMYNQGEIEWGCSGGIRSWGPSGIGGDDGLVYIFGNINGGLLAGRVQPDQVANRDSYVYWDGSSWSSNMPTSSSQAYFIQGPIMDIDVFYSPRHLTFIAVYMTIYADSTFYFRYLLADQGILPPFAPGGDTKQDYVENIFKYKWSDQQVLYKASPGLSGRYIYSGGIHAGYYGANDITNGGSRMLLSWTAPTGQDPASLISEYQIITAEVDWV